MERDHSPVTQPLIKFKKDVIKSLELVICPDISGKPRKWQKHFLVLNRLKFSES
jgi:hypothetical protein